MNTARRMAFLCALLSLPALAARPYRGGVVASAHPASSEAALSMLSQGGNAYDAAVAAAFALAVVGPYHSGVGGGGFAVVFDAKAKTATSWDFREVAPALATRGMYVADGGVVPGLSTDGPLSVAVPGAVAGYLDLQARYGKLPRAKVLAPAIALAEKGFRVTPKYQQMAKMRRDCLAADKEAARLFLRPGKDGTPDVPEMGTLLKQPELAKTLRELAAKGKAPFYTGAIAKKLVAAMKAKGGLLSMEDLAKYEVRERKPLETTYRGHRVVTMPPPSAGGLAVVQVLGLMERFGENRYRDPEAAHRYAEAVRRSYVDRAKHLGDPAFMKLDVGELTSASHLDELHRGIDPAKATRSVTLLPAAPGASASTLPPAPAAPKAHPDGGKNTTHISTLDRDGNAVALTTTVNYAFGSCLVVPGTGVLLNDEMDDFAAQPLQPNAYGLVTGEANAVAPGKTPLSSMSPTLVFTKADPARVQLVVGSPGGPTIPTTVIQVILNVVDHKMDLSRATAYGRLHHQYLPDQLVADRFALEPATRAALEQKGHKIETVEALGDAEAVMFDPSTGLYFAASDPRNEGAGLGQDE